MSLRLKYPLSHHHKNVTCHTATLNIKYVEHLPWIIFPKVQLFSLFLFYVNRVFHLLLYLHIIMIRKRGWWKKNSKNSRSKVHTKEKRSRHPSTKATVITFYDQFIWWSFFRIHFQLLLSSFRAFLMSIVHEKKVSWIFNEKKKLHLNRRIYLVIV